jgi:hypothetical protein
MGQNGNERSGDAMDARREQSDTAQYHFVNNFSIAMVYTGKIILDLAPKIYDTARVLQLVANDGTTYEVQFDPAAKKAYEETKAETELAVSRVFNPSVGRYEVRADVGPNYASKREETYKTISLILTQAPFLANVIGDLMFQAADFPMADEVAARLRRLVPPVALGTGPSENEQQLMEQVKKLQELLQSSMEETAILQLKLKAKDQDRRIDAYKAVTGRIQVAKDMPGGQEEADEAVESLPTDAVKTQLDRLFASMGPMPGIGPQPMPQEQFPGAVRGFNGLNYRSDPATSPRYRPIR